MAVEKNLFQYDFAVVSIMKGASTHLTEWLDYHLMAGVDHFYIFDNDSYDNLKEILQPYVAANIVTYIFYPGKNQRINAYNDAVKNFKFECRYMTFLDVDEFIFPKMNQNILAVTDEILSVDENLGGVEMHRYNYSAKNSEVAEGSLLEQCTRRERKPFEIGNTIVNPRKVDFLFNARYATYFDGVFRVNEYSGKVIDDNKFSVSEKIVVNSYKKPADKKPAQNSDKALDTGRFMLESFYRIKFFDDSIVIYRNDLQKNLEGDVIATFTKNIDDAKLLSVLAKTLLPTFEEDDAVEFFKTPENQLKYFRAIGEFYISAPDEFFQNKMETFVTCFNVASRLQKTLLDENAGKFFVDATLNAICQTLCTEMSTADAYLLLRELPKILPLPYQTVEILLSICAGLLDKLKDKLHNSSQAARNFDIDEDEMTTWKKFTELDYLQKLLKVVNVPRIQVG
ncbi:MAG: glycosyltransferase family 92 protein [Selenomonadaceae bacterium]|nr:glycosyltransferase family 92 protein [Selenomonadaceae bacterium]